MFQSYALFPHLNVFNNLAFGIKDHFDKNEISAKVNEISKLLSIENLLDRENILNRGGTTTNNLGYKSPDRSFYIGFKLFAILASFI